MSDSESAHLWEELTDRRIDKFMKLCLDDNQRRQTREIFIGVRLLILRHHTASAPEPLLATQKLTHSVPRFLAPPTLSRILLLPCASINEGREKN